MFKDLLKLNRDLLSKSVDADDHKKHAAAVVVIDLERQKILLGKRYSDGIWTNPAGHMKGDESPTQTAIREAFEESNLQLKPRMLKDLPSVQLKKNKLCHGFLVYVDSKKVNIHTGNDPDKEISKWEWFDLNKDLPSPIDEGRMTCINNAKMRMYGLKKAIVENPDAGIDLNTAEQSADELGSRGDSFWVESIVELMMSAEYGDVPRELILPKYLKMYVSKVDDGLFSAVVKREDPDAGDLGEVQVNFAKMTPESMVQALKAKGYLPKTEKEEPIAEVVKQPSLNDYEGLLDVLKESLKEMKGDVHIHLHKALQKALLTQNEDLQKGKPFPVGTTRTWAGKNYIKQNDGWTEVSNHHGKTRESVEPGSSKKERVSAPVENAEFEAIQERAKESARARLDTPPKLTVEGSRLRIILGDGSYTEKEILPGNEAVAQMYLQQAQDLVNGWKLTQKQFLKQALASGRGLDGKLSKHTKNSLIGEHKWVVQQAQLAGKKLSPKVEADYVGAFGFTPTNSASAIEDALPKVADLKTQSKTNMIKDVDFSKAGKENSQKLTQYLNECDSVLGSLGIQFKSPIKFFCTGAVKAEQDLGGTYFPADKSIRIRNLHRAPKTIMHEIGHALDFAMQDQATAKFGPQGSQGRSAEMKNLSESDTALKGKFDELYKVVTDSAFYQNKKGTKGAYGYEYYTEPTEVFARAFEIYTFGKAKEMHAEGKISKDFLEHFMPDVFLDDSEYKKLISDGDVLDKLLIQKNLKLAKINEDLRVKAKTTLSEGPGSKTGEEHYVAIADEVQRLQTNDAGYLAAKEDREEVIQKVRATASRRKSALNSLIEPQKQAEYVSKISELMDFIFKNDQIRKALEFLVKSGY